MVVSHAHETARRLPPDETTLVLDNFIRHARGGRLRGADR
jgi:hypothetical protein